MSVADKIALSESSWNANDRAQVYPPVRPTMPHQRNELSFAQAGLWALCQMELASLAYVVPVAWQLKGHLNLAALESSLQEIFRRHENLRTVFGVVGGMPVSTLNESCVFNLEHIDLQGCARENLEFETQRTMVRALRRPMDITQGPLFRAVLIQLRPDEFVLILMVHHLVADGSSMGVIVSEIEVLYEALQAGSSPRLPDLPFRFSDFVAWQRGLLTPELLDSQVAYWKAQLAGAPPLIQLPTDRPRPAVQTFNGGVEGFILDRELTAGISDISRRCGVTVFMVLCSALQTLLHRYTASEDVISAWLTDGRERQELQGVIGDFVNPVVLRTNFTSESTFRDILRNVRRTMLQGYAHREVPFEKIVEALQPERSPSYNPIFQVAFAQQKGSWLTLKLKGMESRLIPVSNGTAKVDLHFYVVEGAEELAGWLEFSSDIFDRQTIQRMLGHFQTLLANAVAAPDQPVATLPMMCARERDQLVVEWNDTAAEFPSATIPQLFEKQAARTPESPAFIFEGDVISFQDLNSKANRLARALAGLGAGRGMRIGVSMRRSLELPIALLAILKTGSAYVTLDTAHPAERLVHIVGDAGIKLLICDQAPSWSATMAGLKTVSVQAILASGKVDGDKNFDTSLEPDDAAYAIYTSGSTGLPKGIVTSHRGTVNCLAWMWHAYPYSPGEINCAKTSLNFVDSVGELWGALLQGVPTVLLSDEVIKDPPRLVQALASNRVSRIILVPSLLRAMLETGEDLSTLLPHLKYWISSGEILPVSVLKEFQRLLPNRTLLNLYGSSEIAAGDATCFKVEGNSEMASVPIGRPIWNTQTYILDAAQAPVPIGIPGEIYMGGVGLASGYLNLPELSARRFAEHPTLNSSGRLLFRTGDRARYLADGNIEFLGRMDNQVKVRGFRVELGEIESWLSLHPDVRQVAVVAFDDDISNIRIVAYVVPKSSSPLVQQMGESTPGKNGSSRNSANADFDADYVAELRSYLESKLPGYMVPSAFVLTDVLPMLPNGKVNRRALPDPGTSAIRPKTSHVAPRDALERQLTEIWQQSLGIEHIGIHDDFFALGGHSLLAVSMLKQVEKATGKKVPLVALLQSATIEGFANLLRKSGWTTPPVVAIQPKGARPAFFCVYDRFDYGNLQGVLGEDQPLYALTFDQMFDVQVNRDVLDVTREFVSRIRNMQPQGPYYLGGMCLGGRIAFAIACELYRQGQTVGLLAIFDSPAPGVRSAVAAMPWKKRLRHQFLDEVEFEWDILKNQTFRQRVDTIKDTIKLDAERYVRRFRWRATKRLYRFLGREISLKNRDSFHLMRETIRDYCPPEPYPGKVTLFRPAQRPGKAHRSEGMGWEKFPVGALEIHIIPGRHIEMLRQPNAQIVGRILSEGLIKAQGEARSGNRAARS